MNYIRVLVFIVALITTVVNLAAQVPKSPLVAEITGADLGGDFLGVSPEGFDISPDGSQIAVVFETAQKEGEVKAAGIWVAVWDLSTKKLLNKVEIEGPLTAEQLSTASMLRDLRYTPGGNTVVVQSGLRIVVVRAADLVKVQSVSPMSLPTTSRNGTFIRGFDVSGDGRWLAVLTGTGLDSRPIAGIQLIDLSDGKVAGQWVTSDPPSSIALSQDGSKILLSGLGAAGERLGDARLVDASTGKIVRGFQSGCEYLAACGASDARFWGDRRMVMVPKAATDAHGRSLASDMRIFDLESGQLLRTLKRRRFQSMGKLTMADNAPIVLTVSAWETPGEIISERWFRHSRPELVAFNLDDGASRTIVRPVTRGQGGHTVDQYSLRISHDGSLVAFFQERAIRIYRLSPSDLPLKVGQRTEKHE